MNVLNAYGQQVHVRAAERVREDAFAMANGLSMQTYAGAKYVTMHISSQTGQICADSAACKGADDEDDKNNSDEGDADDEDAADRAEIPDSVRRRKRELGQVSTNHFNHNLFFIHRSQKQWRIETSRRHARRK